MELAVDLRQVGGAFSVEENARRIIHYRYAEIAALEAEAGWVITMAAPPQRRVRPLRPGDAGPGR